MLLLLLFCYAGIHLRFHYLRGLSAERNEGLGGYANLHFSLTASILEAKGHSTDIYTVQFFGLCLGINPERICTMGTLPQLFSCVMMANQIIININFRL